MMNKATRLRLLIQVPKTFCSSASLPYMNQRIARKAVRSEEKEAKEVQSTSQSMFLISNGYKELIKN